MRKTDELISLGYIIRLKPCRGLNLGLRLGGSPAVHPLHWPYLPTSSITLRLLRVYFPLFYLLGSWGKYPLFHVLIGDLVITIPIKDIQCLADREKIIPNHLRNPKTICSNERVDDFFFPMRVTDLAHFWHWEINDKAMYLQSMLSPLRDGVDGWVGCTSRKESSSTDQIL